MNRIILLLVLLSAHGDAQNVRKVVAGYIIGYLIHESGHVMAGYATRSKTHWVMRGPEPYYWIDRSNHSDIIGGAGFVAEAVAFEAIQAGEWNDYKTGIALETIINPVLYIVRDRIQGGWGDMEVMRRHGVDMRTVTIGLVAHSAFNLIRLKYRISERLHTHVSGTTLTIQVML